MKAIILNGYHQGEVHNVPRLVPSLCLMKPMRYTLCDCNDENPTTADFEESREEYKITFVSVDRTFGLYTTNGDPSEIIKSRDWVLDKKRQYYSGMKPIYIGCRDERAFQ